MQAYNLRKVDREYEIYLSAWVNREVNAEKSVGKDKTELVYKKFDKFYDYEKREREAFGESEVTSDKYKDLLKIAKRLKERRKQTGKV